MKKIVVLIVTVALILGAGMLLKKRKQGVKDAPLPIPVTYQVEIVSPVTARLEQTRSFLAHLSAKETATISSKLSGRIQKVLVKENQPVQAGDLLLQIDDRETVAAMTSLQVSLTAQQSDLQYVKSLHERNRSLFQAGGLAREKFESSGVMLASKKAAVEASRQKIAGLEAQLEYLRLTAPFTGTVGTVFSRNGDLASPGKPLLTVNSPEQKLTFSYVPKGTAVKVGQDVFVQGKKTGTVVSLYSDATNHLSVAETDVENPLPQPNNSYVTIDLLTFSGSGCRVPVKALLQKDSGVQVMCYKDEKFTSYPVTVIAENMKHALVAPCPDLPVAVAAEAKLSQLPGLARVLAHRGKTDEE